MAVGRGGCVKWNGITTCSIGLRAEWNNELSRIFGQWRFNMKHSRLFFWEAETWGVLHWCCHVTALRQCSAISHCTNSYCNAPNMRRSKGCKRKQALIAVFDSMVLGWSPWEAGRYFTTCWMWGFQSGILHHLWPSLDKTFTCLLSVTRA